MTRLTQTTSLLLLSTALATGGCRRGDDDEASAYRDALPTREAVELKVPARAVAGQALEVERVDQALLGQISESYRLTVAVRDTVNGGTLGILALLKGITSFRPTTVTANTAVWGPWADALKPNAYRLTVTRVSPTRYDYKLDGKDKHLGDEAFVTVLSGTHTPLLDAAGDPIEHFGEGTFTLDFEKARTLPEHKDTDRGTATISYRRADTRQDTTVQAKFLGAWDADEMKFADVDYSYAHHPDDGGVLEFSYDPKTTNPGKAWIKSRWLPTGAGRSDWRVEAEGLPMTATASDCWDTYFKSVFYTSNYEPAKDYGSEAACAFTPAEYSTLKL